MLRNRSFGLWRVCTEGRYYIVSGVVDERDGKTFIFTGIFDVFFLKKIFFLQGWELLGEQPRSAGPASSVRGAVKLAVGVRVEMLLARWIIRG